MINEHALRNAFSEYAAALLENYDIGHVLDRLSDQTVDVLGGDGAGVSLDSGDGELQFVTATDDRASRVETAQIDAGDGPCYTAFRSGDVTAVTDLEQDTRWEEFRRSALDVGYRSVAGIPMPIAEVRIGALNLYRAEPHEWSREELDVAQLLANVASGYILNWRGREEQTAHAGQLQHALDSRVVIEQAKGILVERHGITADDAFQRLRQHAREHSTRLHDIARQVVAGELRL